MALDLASDVPCFVNRYTLENAGCAERCTADQRKRHDYPDEASDGPLDDNTKVQTEDCNFRDGHTQKVKELAKVIELNIISASSF